MPYDLRKRGPVRSAAATLSAICTRAAPSAPPILRTAAYRPVQPSKTAGRSTSSRRVPSAGKQPREHHQTDSPHARHAQAPNRDSKPVHLPSTRDAPSTYFSQTRATGHRREPSRTRSARRKRIRSLPASTKNDTRRKSRPARLIARIGRIEGVRYAHTYALPSRF